MKKIFYFSCLLALSLLLVGCMSIPVGDQTLKLSTDGVELVENEGEEVQENPIEEENPSVDEAEKAEGDEKQSTEEQVDKEQSVIEEDQEDVDKEQADRVQENKGEKEREEKENRQCVEQDLSLLTEELVEDFYIPACAELTNVSKSNQRVDAYVKVEGDWQETAQAYKKYFGDRITSENQNISDKAANLIADFGENDGKAEVRISQDGEFVSMRIIYNQPSKD